MESISAEEAARELLACCIESRAWPDQLLELLLADDGSSVLFSIVAEGLGDRFEPRLCDAYSHLFAEVISHKIPELHAPHLVERYLRIRKARRFAGDPSGIRNVFVLSRITLGADITVTSVLLDAARQRFPHSQIFFVGPRKSFELFEGAPHFRHLPLTYGRDGSITDRLSVFPALREMLCQPGSLVIDPDSRLTQLGLLPVCPEEDYFFFESRAYGAGSDDSLVTLTSRWAAETFGVGKCSPFLSPLPEDSPSADITVSLGVGENPAKRIPDPFEQKLVAYLATRGSVLIDKGAGGEEAERVGRAIAGTAGANIRAWEGSFAGFASLIARSKLYVGYDSAGGHAAAASGVPLVSVFTGFPAERMFHRWRPFGSDKIVVLRADEGDPAQIWERTRRAIEEMRG